MKQHLKSTVETFLDWSPILTGAAAALVTRTLTGSADWQGPLIASQVALLATAFTRFRIEWNRHKSDVERSISLLETEISSGKYVRRCFDRLLQVAVFGDSRIDDKLWLHLGKEISEEAEARLDEAVRKVVEALDRRTITTRDDHYRYMRSLLDYVTEYRAVCFVDQVKVNAEGEIDDTLASYFLFNAPLDYARKKKKVFRLFYLKNFNEFQKFSGRLRDLLRQQLKEDSVYLKYRTTRHAHLTDFGVYGEVAVGRLQNDINVIALDGSQAKSMRKDWEDLWNDRDSLPLTGRELGFSKTQES